MQSITITSTLIPNSNLQTSIISEYSGLLNTDYKNIVKTNFKSFNSPSLFSIKQRVKSNQFKTCSSIGTGLKVLTFVVGIIVAFI
ncbi:hypothetical protein [Lacinutrix jangbogonensis]|uniref:hypothetical protein n=1 Tax=Lacinutrix jangbogonensis TaxID=1469557 RepID=UPI00053E359E|nr:hypothetical protein [Lacinutrix jangbogonensis]